MEQMDMELKKAFTEMQINKIETTKKMNVIDMKCDVVKTGKQKYQLTEKGTSDLSDDTRSKKDGLRELVQQRKEAEAAK
ncbi:hypothetical protein DOY81_010697 [Sarcophaga bullata]|nr:hypothetical protein DOY81_010697 [Sarcophaga bullata]